MLISILIILVTFLFKSTFARKLELE